MPQGIGYTSGEMLTQLKNLSQEQKLRYLANNDPRFESIISGPPVSPAFIKDLLQKTLGKGASKGAQSVQQLLQENTRQAPGPLQGDPRMGPKMESGLMATAEVLKNMFDSARRGDFSQ